jgi:hypothetical protein
MRNMVLGRPLISEDHMIQWGCAVSEKDQEQRRLYKESINRKKDKCNKPDSRSSHEVSNSKPKVVCQVKSIASVEKLRGVREELEAVLKRLDTIQNEESKETGSASVLQAPHPANLHGVDADSAKTCLLSSSPLARVQVGSSASTKIDYILNEVSRR